MMIASVLVGLRRRSYLICHPVIASAYAESVGSLVGDVVSMVVFNCVSLANCLPYSEHCDEVARVIKMENNSRPRSEPCGMPENNFTIHERQLATPTNCSANKLRALPLSNHTVEVEEVFCSFQKTVMIEGIKRCTNV